jgi:YgiT-type zinc finger domain-containing protein
MGGRSSRGAPTWSGAGRSWYEARMYRCSQCNEGEMLPGLVDDYEMSAFFGLDARLVHAAALVCNHCGEVTLEGPCSRPRSAPSDG